MLHQARAKATQPSVLVPSGAQLCSTGRPPVNYSSHMGYSQHNAATQQCNSPATAGCGPCLKVEG